MFGSRTPSSLADRVEMIWRFWGGMEHSRHAAHDVVVERFGDFRFDDVARACLTIVDVRRSVDLRCLSGVASGQEEICFVRDAVDQDGNAAARSSPCALGTSRRAHASVDRSVRRSSPSALGRGSCEAFLPPRRNEIHPRVQKSSASTKSRSSLNSASVSPGKPTMNDVRITMCGTAARISARSFSMKRRGRPRCMPFKIGSAMCWAACRGTGGPSVLRRALRAGRERVADRRSGDESIGRLRRARGPESSAKDARGVRSVPYPVKSCAIRFTSTTPRAPSVETSSTMSAIGRLRWRPRILGIAQKEHFWSQPSETFTYAAWGRNVLTRGVVAWCKKRGGSV